MAGSRDRLRNGRQGREVAVNKRITRQKRQVKLLDVVSWDEDEPVTVGDTIAQAVRASVPPAQAARAVGVSEYTFRSWMREGAQLAIERAEAESIGERRRQLSHRQQGLLWFYEEMQQALAAAEANLARSLHALATGDGLSTGQVVRKIERQVQGDGTVKEVEVERKVTQANVLPNVEANKFLLRAMAPERWAANDKVEVVGAGGGPVEHHHTHSVPVLEDMVAKVAAKLQGRDEPEPVAPLGPDSQPTIEATATES